MATVIGKAPCRFKDATRMTDREKKSWSVIIPTLNEAREIGRLLRHLSEVMPEAEVIVVDGGSEDATLEVATRHPRVKGFALPGAPRGALLNRGAEASCGEWLLFLHADTYPQGPLSPAQIEERMRGAVAGAFRFRLRSERWSSRIVAWGVALRNRLFALPYGDQGLVIRREDFFEIGGYRPLPLLEDVEILDRLRRRGRIVLLPFSAWTSARRYERLGVLRTTVINYVVIAAYRFGVSPWTLARFYRSRGATTRIFRWIGGVGRRLRLLQ
ncbi:MAG: glycosyltransferase [Deltaproteobacteria bacterium]|nr:MAG: glycosyltransferase [Deltaproteobacteria bacterium]